jgi:hypothetical protein
VRLFARVLPVSKIILKISNELFVGQMDVAQGQGQID